MEIENSYRMIPLDVDYKDRMQFWDSATDMYGKRWKNIAKVDFS